MQWIPCSVVECSGFYAAWSHGTLLNVVDVMQHDWMQWIPCIPIECSGFYAAWPKASRCNAVKFLQHVPIHPDWMQWIPCSMIECSGFYAAWPKASWLNTVDYMQRQWMRGFHALWRNGSRLYAVESMQCDECMDSRQPGKMHPDWMQWIPCSMIECSGFYAAWPKASWLNAVDYM